MPLLGHATAVNSAIIYEFPLNERIRIFIRLEQLFKQFKYHITLENNANKHAAISVLLNIVAIFKRNDLKSEILKELERQANVLSKIAQKQSNEVDTQKLQELLLKLRETSQRLYTNTGKIGSHLIENDLFQSIAQRSSIPGGTCSFDLPEFHFWLSQEMDIYLQDLTNWSRPFVEMSEAIDIVLGFIRNSGSISEEIATAGFFQITLDTQLSNQLLSVCLDKTLPYFAEMSGGKHRCAIRFLESSCQRPLQCLEDVPFTLIQYIL